MFPLTLPFTGISGDKFQCIPLIRTLLYTIANPKNLNHLQYMQYTVESSHMDTENNNLEKDGKGMSMYFLLDMAVFGV